MFGLAGGASRATRQDGLGKHTGMLLQAFRTLFCHRFHSGYAVFLSPKSWHFAHFWLGGRRMR